MSDHKAQDDDVKQEETASYEPLDLSKIDQSFAGVELMGNKRWDIAEEMASKTGFPTKSLPDWWQASSLPDEADVASLQKNFDKWRSGPDSYTITDALVDSVHKYALQAAATYTPAAAIHESIQTVLTYPNKHDTKMMKLFMESQIEVAETFNPEHSAKHAASLEALGEFVRCRMLNDGPSSQVLTENALRQFPELWVKRGWIMKDGESGRYVDVMPSRADKWAAFELNPSGREPSQSWLKGSQDPDSDTDDDSSGSEDLGPPAKKSRTRGSFAETIGTVHESPWFGSGTGATST